MAESAIAARAITNAGSGHKYWSAFGKVIQAKIEELAKSLNHILYTPPISGVPINTLDVPVAGQGYNALPFVFDLVNVANDVEIADTSNKKNVKDSLPVDPDGQLTLDYLNKVKGNVEKITTDKSKSLGLHPVVYFYTRGGAFKTESFFAALAFIKSLESKKSNRRFILLARQSRTRS